MDGLKRMLDRAKYRSQYDPITYKKVIKKIEAKIKELDKQIGGKSNA